MILGYSGSVPNSWSITQVYGKKAFKEPLSDGAIRLLDALMESNEPLYIPVWGGTNTLAQALKHLAETASEEEAAKQRAKLRVYAISDQDDTGSLDPHQVPPTYSILFLRTAGTSTPGPAG